MEEDEKESKLEGSDDENAAPRVGWAVPPEKPEM